MPPPASTTGRALSACSPLPIGRGTNIAGNPTPETSVTVFEPEQAPLDRTRQLTQDLQQLLYALNTRPTDTTAGAGTTSRTGQGPDDVIDADFSSG